MGQWLVRSSVALPVPLLLRKAHRDQAVTVITMKPVISSGPTEHGSSFHLNTACPLLSP